MEKAIKIQKSKNIRLQLTGLISFAILFSVCLCYFLGWKFELKTFFIAVAILIALLLIPWVICLFLIKFERQYYLIEKEQITLWKNDNLLCELKKSDFVEIEYQRFVWAFLMQMGSGYLNITCPVEVLSDKKIRVGCYAKRYGSIRNFNVNKAGKRSCKNIK